jgi:RHS repeat-associated protein
MASNHAARGVWIVLRLLVAAGLVASVAAGSGVDPTKISLPRGPGSIEGLGTADVSPSLSTGSASYEVAIAVPPASGGFGPSVALAYDSGGGVTELGMGFRLAGIPKLRRRTEGGLPRFDGSDTFELVGLGASSALLEIEPGVFRPELEDGTFVRVVRDASGTRWEARTKAGVTFRFGGEGATEGEARRAAGYLLREQLDHHGHVITYEWDASEGHALLTRVVWNDFDPGSRNEIRLAYETRPDPISRYSSGIRQEITRRLRSLEVTHGGALVRRYDLGYGEGSHPALATLELVGRDGTSKLPAARFGYTTAELPRDASGLVTMESPPGRSPADPDSTLADLDGDGLPDLLVAKAGHYRSYLNHDGKRWLPPVDWAEQDSPSVSLSDVGVELADLDADGAPDLVAKSGRAEFRYFPRPRARRFDPPVSIATVPGFSLEDPNVRLADMDGDRRTDVVLTTDAGLAIAYNLGGKDFTDATVVGPVGAEAPAPVLFSDGHTALCDVNGDRVQDLCTLRAGALAYWLGRGRGSFEEPRTATGVPPFEDTAPYRLLDLNGDGWIDLVRVGGNAVSVALAVGEGQFSPVRTIDGTPARTPTTIVEFADMNASGTLDIVWIDAAGAEASSFRYLELFPGGRVGLLARIDNGLGKVQVIDYKAAASDAGAARSAGKPWETRLNLAMPVVARISVDLSLGDPVRVTEFSYRDGVYDPHARTFAGFGGGTRRALGDAGTPTLVTEDTFDTGQEERVLQGALLGEEQRTLEGYVFSRTTNEYARRSLATAPDGRSVRYAFRSAERIVHVEGTAGAAGARTTLTEYEQDGYGNVTDERRWGEIVGDDRLAGHDEALTHRTFANDPGEWLLGYVATEELTDAAGGLVAMRRKYYDGEPFTGLPLGEVAQGDVAREEAWAGPGRDAFELVSATRYDEHGLPVEIRDGRGGGRFYDWASDHTTLERERVKLGADRELVEAAVTDPAFGSLLAVTEYNGQTTHFELDAFGRLARTIRPGDTLTRPTVEVAYEAGSPLSRISTHTRRESGRDAADVSEQLVDGSGMKRGTLTRDGDRWVLAGVATLDARGGERRTLLPRWVGEAEHALPPLLDASPPGTEAWHDARGRELRTRSASGVETRTEYRPLERRHWDGGQADQASPYEHTPAIERVDGLGRTVAHGRTLRGQELWARYTHDAAGNLSSRTDVEGHVATYGYDGRGRRTAVHDPDLGNHTFVFDPTGNMVALTRPDGVTSRFTFDLGGRPLTEDWNGDGQPEVTKTWDRSPDGHAEPLYGGKLTRVAEPSGSIDHEYDARGRVTRTHYAIGGATYTVGTEYDAQDRETLHVYPDGSSVDLRRNARGQIEGYGSAVSIRYDGDGLETERRFGKGVSVESGYDADRRRADFTLRDAEGRVVEALHWTFDAAGNLTALRDLRPGVSPAEDRSEAYEYDTLYRLVGARGSWGSAAWRFSPGGNLTGRDSTVPALQVTRVGYGSLPHAPTAFDDRRVEYDARGRMLTDGRRSYAWNDADQLVRVAERGGGSVESVYAADGARRARVERAKDGTATTTHFVDAWSDVKDGKLVRYIVHGGQRIVRLGDRPGAGASAGVSAPGGRPNAAERWAALARSVTPAALLLALIAALVATYRRTVRRVLRVGLLAAGVLVTVAACGSDAPESAAVSDHPGGPGTVTELAAGDTVLATDLLGSLLVETDSQGNPRAHFAAFPFGVARTDTSAASHRYAGSPRDAAIGLDHMGARFYAPDLGIWTSGEPLAITAPERLATDQFAAANPYAYANLSPVVSADRDGHLWHIAIGAAIGALMGGAIEAGRQYLEHGRISDFGRIGAASAGGAVAGAITAALPAMGLAASLSAEGAVNAASGVAQRIVASRGRSVGTLRDVAVDAAVGVASGGVVKGVKVGAVEFSAWRTWQGGTINMKSAEDTIMYRIWGGKSGQSGSWLSPFRPTSAAASRGELALPHENTAEFFSEVRVPAGTRWQTGVAAARFGERGGGMQVRLLDQIPKENFGAGVKLDP